jgi:hypothetical protein
MPLLHTSRVRTSVADVLPGKLEDIPFGIFAMKEPDYVISLMATYGMDDKIESSNAT